VLATVSGALEHLKSQSGVGVAAVLCTFKCRLPAVEVSAPAEDDTEAARRRRVTPGVRQPVRSFGAGEISALLQQRSQVEGAVHVAALSRAPIAVFRLVQRTAHLQQHPEVERGSRMPEQIGLPVRAFRGGEIPALLEQHAEVESLDRVAALDCQLGGGVCHERLSVLSSDYGVVG
jgi:hypothetical protein